MYWSLSFFFFFFLLIYPWVGAGETNNPEMPMGKDKASQMLVVLVKVAQSCLTLCDPKNYTVLGILQARILEWVVFPFSMGSSQPRDWTQVSHIPGGFFTSWTTREAQMTPGKESAASAGDTGNTCWFPRSGRSPGGGNEACSSILSWKIPWTQKPGGL